MAIPFATLRYSVPRETTTVQMWGIQFTRIIRRENQVTSLPLFPRAYTPYRMSYAGDLVGMMPPPPRLNIRLQPYLLQDVRATSAVVTGAPQVGGEVKWAITPNDVLDLTVNTDFAQADVR
jgi:hypothetical protein